MLTAIRKTLGVMSWKNNPKVIYLAEGRWAKSGVHGLQRLG